MNYISLFLMSLLATGYLTTPIVSPTVHTALVSKTVTDSTRVYFYTFGIIDQERAQHSCEEAVQAEYGFGYKSKGSCMMDDLTILKRIQAHNAKVEATLVNRHGENWREAYDKTVAKRCKEQ